MNTRRKHQHWKLSHNQVEALKDLLNDSYTNQQLADRIGITLGQLVNPLYGISDCSKASYGKIVRFLNKQKA